MRKLNLGFVLLLAALAISCSCIKENCPCGRKGEAVFNGRDLSNWTAVSSKPEVKMEDVWSVRDGIIVCKGDPIGYIATAKSYQNFKLNAEYRWAPGATPGNSGLFLRINGQPRALPRCVECQLKNGNAGDLYGFHGMQINGEAARRKEVKGHELGGDFVGVTRIEGNEKPAGEWNKVEIVAEGGNVTVWMNGKKVNEAFGVEQVAGPIGLQSEGGEVHFRKVYVKPLP